MHSQKPLWNPVWHIYTFSFTYPFVSLNHQKDALPILIGRSYLTVHQPHPIDHQTLGLDHESDHCVMISLPTEDTILVQTSLKLKCDEGGRVDVPTCKKHEFFFTIHTSFKVPSRMGEQALTPYLEVLLQKLRLNSCMNDQLKQIHLQMETYEQLEPASRKQIWKRSHSTGPEFCWNIIILSSSKFLSRLRVPRCGLILPEFWLKSFSV